MEQIRAWAQVRWPARAFTDLEIYSLAVEYLRTQPAAAAALAAARAASAAAPTPAAAAAQPAEEAVVEIEDDDRPVGTEEAEEGNFAAYRADAVRRKHPDIMGHPDPLVETASLASVPLPPADFDHSLSDCIAERLLSDAQLETIIYANRKFEGPPLADGKRSGFFLGDGAGVGKGRQIGALIRQHWHAGGRHILWVSVSTDLKLDAVRDLNDVKADYIPVHPQGQSSLPGNKKLDFQGVLFCTYSLLVSGLGGKKAAADARAAALAEEAEANMGEDPNAAGPSSRRKNSTEDMDLRINVPASSRLHQIIAWLKRCPLGPLVVFDECHKAKNLLPTGGGSPSQTARAVVELQEQLPTARILYSSATGASEPRNLAYMTRLGMWGFKDAKEMIELLSRSKLGALELAAMSMKATGTYLARTLSYEGAEFALAYVDIDPHFRVIYDRSCMFWNLLWKVVVAHPKLKKLQGVFWSAHQRFFKQMLMGCKVAACAKLVQDAIAAGNCAVIGLQSTGEANTNTQKEVLQESGEDFDDLVSAPRMIIEKYIRGQFPINSGGMSKASMDELEYQVFEAVKQWRSMLPVAEVVGQATLGANAAQLMGMNVHTRGQHSEDQLIAMRNEARLEEERQRKIKEEERVAKWHEAQARRQEALQAEKIAAEAELAEERRTMRGLQAALDQANAARAAPKVKAEPKAAPRGGVISDSSDEDMPLAEAVRRPSLPLKRKNFVPDSDTEEESEAPAGQENAGAAALRPASAAGSAPGGAIVRRPSLPLKRKNVVADSDTEEESEAPAGQENAGAAALRPASAAVSAGGACPLSPVSKNHGVLGANRPAGGRSPMKVDLTVDEETVDLLSQGEEKGGAAQVLEDHACQYDLASDPACQACGGCEDGENLMLCSGCERAFHCACVQPPLAAPPSGSWTCSSCTRPPGGGTVPVKADPTAAVKPEPGSQHLGAGAAKRRAGRVAWSASDDDSEDDSRGIKAGEGPARIKMKLIATGRREAAAERKVAIAAESLARQAALTARGPPGSRPRLQPQDEEPQGRHDVKVRAITLRSEYVEGFRHTVAVKGLDDLPEDLPSDDEDDFRIPDPEMNADISPQLMRMRGWLLRLAGAMELPPNPLDHLVSLLGGEAQVAELTGRKGFVAMDLDTNRAVFRQRGQDEGFAQKDLNLREKDAFMAGRKLVAIISDAASTGISLQADRRVANQRRRVHITLELPWSADKAIQQFGRSHRANQVSAPMYRILCTPAGGEYRFASAAAKRLSSLGALLRGDRNAVGAGSELKSFDIDNALGEKALERVLRDVIGLELPMPSVSVPTLPPECALPEFLHVRARDAAEDPNAPFFQYFRTKLASVGMLDSQEGIGQSDICMPKGKVKIARFLNRLLGLPLVDQELLFQYFTDTLEATLAQARSEGHLDSGIITVGSRGQTSNVASRELLHQDPQSGGHVHHVKLSMDRGVSWEAATAFKKEMEDRLEEAEPGRKHLSGFYTQRGHTTMLNGQRKGYIVLATEIIRAHQQQRSVLFRIQRPNVGHVDPMTQGAMDHKGYIKINDAQAEPLWNLWHQYCNAGCYHGDACHFRRRGQECHIGSRLSDMHLICGAVLPIWMRLQKWHKISGFAKKDKYGKAYPLRVIKCITTGGEPIVGVEATCEDQVDDFRSRLAQTPEEEAAAEAAAAAARGQAGSGARKYQMYKQGKGGKKNFR